MLSFFKKAPSEMTARDIDRKLETEQKRAIGKCKRSLRERRKVKKTTIQTMPYECFVSNYVMLNKSTVRIGNDTANLYSKTYLVPDVNYSALTQAQQLEKMQNYIDLLNGFDSSVSVQISIVNTKINNEEFARNILLKDQQDGLDDERHEFNQIITDKIMQGQRGLHCRKFITRRSTLMRRALDFSTWKRTSPPA